MKAFILVSPATNQNRRVPIDYLMNVICICDLEYAWIPHHHLFGDDSAHQEREVSSGVWMIKLHKSEMRRLHMHHVIISHDLERLLRFPNSSTQIKHICIILFTSIGMCRKRECSSLTGESRQRLTRTVSWGSPSCRTSKSSPSTFYLITAIQSLNLWEEAFITKTPYAVHGNRL